MHEHRSMTLHYIVRAAISLGFSLYVAYLVHIDKLQYYIVPRMMPHVKVAAFALFLLAWCFVYLAVRGAREGEHAHGADCDCGHEPPRSPLRTTLVYGLFAIPLLIGFGLPDQIMASDAAAVKGMNLQAAGAPRQEAAAPPADADVLLPPGEPSLPPGEPSLPPGEPSLPPGEPSLPPGEPSPPPGDRPAAGADAPLPDSPPDTAAGDPLDRLFPSDAYTEELAKVGKRLYGKDVIRVREEGFLEIVTLLDLYRNNFIGKTVVMSGFVYREDDMGQDRFVVARMAMQCCSADAMPFGFLAEWGRGSELAKDAWVTVTGELGLTEYNGNEIIELQVRKLERMDAPDDPYVYPYFGSYDKLGED